MCTVLICRQRKLNHQIYVYNLEIRLYYYLWQEKSNAGKS